jgi:AbrB family looped-hinge helix DNA binding protein
MAKETGMCHSRPYKLRVSAGGRIVIPAEVRERLGVTEGDELLLTSDERGVRLATVDGTVKDIQAYFSQFKKQGESVVDEFLRDRREEAAREERDFEEKRSRRRA